jgi:predicted RNase H-like nuclease
MPFVIVAGFDGCRDGWLGVALLDGAFHAAGLFPHFRGAYEAWPEADVFGIDIPIGLPVDCPRAADLAARVELGARAAASVFLIPPRPILEAPTYEEACRRSRQLLGAGISKQSYALRSKILEVDVLARQDERIHEVHPEVSFRAMAPERGALRDSKRTWGGLMERRTRLAVHGITIPDELGEAGRAGADDVLDAAAAAWSALRRARGEARPLPDPPERLDGRDTAIWY